MQMRNQNKSQCYCWCMLQSKNMFNYIQKTISFSTFLLIVVLRASWAYLYDAAVTKSKYLLIYYRLTKELNDPYLSFKRQIHHVYSYEYTRSTV